MATVEEKRAKFIGGLRDKQQKRGPSTPPGLRSNKQVGRKQLAGFVSDMDRPQRLPQAAPTRHQDKPVGLRRATQVAGAPVAASVAAATDAARPGLRGQVGDTGFNRSFNKDTGVTEYSDAGGNSLSGQRTGGGSFSTVSGPGGPADPNDIPGSIQRNVDAYNRQTAALRGLREARSGISGATSAMRRGSGVTIIPDGDAPARDARHARMDAADIAEGLNKRGKGGSIRGQIEAAKLRSSAADRQASLRGQDVTAQTTRRGQDLDFAGQGLRAQTDRRGQDMDQQASLTKAAADLEKARATGGLGERKYELDSAKFARDEINNLSEVFTGTQDPDNPERYNQKKRQFNDFMALSGVGTHSDPGEVAAVGQVMRTLKPLADIEAIGTSIWPAAAKMFDMLKGSSTPILNAKDAMARLREIANSGTLTVGNRKINVENDWTPQAQQMLMEQLANTRS